MRIVFIHPVAEHVDLVARDVSAQLHTGNEGDAWVAAQRLPHLIHPLKGIVIRERHHLQPVAIGNIG
jgi:hypothetical protein